MDEFSVVLYQLICLCCLRSLSQDLQKEGQVMRVGSLAARWVLAQHADPWLLALQSKRATSHPTRDEPKTQSSTRKRGRQDTPRETECPAKRPTVDAGEAEPGEKGPGDATEERRREEELGSEEGGDGGKPMNVEEEGGQQTQPEDVAGKKKMEAEKEQEKTESGVRDE